MRTKYHALCIGVALAISSAQAGTLFDEDGNKIDTCQGSTCASPPSGGSNGGAGGAGGAGGTGIGVGIGKGGSAASRANSTSRSRANSASNSQSNSASNSQSNSGGNTLSQEVTINGALAGGHGGGKIERQVGIAPDIAAVTTAPCRIGVGGSGGWLQGTLGFTFGVLDEGCDTWRDTVGLAEVLKRPDAALKRACQKPEIAAALGVEECPKDSSTQAYAEPHSLNGWSH
jgi:hypothetical protein